MPRATRCIGGFAFGGTVLTLFPRGVIAFALGGNDFTLYMDTYAAIRVRGGGGYTCGGMQGAAGTHMWRCVHTFLGLAFDSTLGYPGEGPPTEGSGGGGRGGGGGAGGQHGGGGGGGGDAAVVTTPVTQGRVRCDFRSALILILMGARYVRVPRLAGWRAILYRLRGVHKLHDSRAQRRQNAGA